MQFCHVRILPTLAVFGIVDNAPTDLSLVTDFVQDIGARLPFRYSDDSIVRKVSVEFFKEVYFGALTNLVRGLALKLPFHVSHLLLVRFALAGEFSLCLEDGPI